MPPPPPPPAGVVNKLFCREAGSRRRHLYLRTYAVLPLTEDCGILQWVNNLAAFKACCEEVYSSEGLYKRRWGAAGRTGAGPLGLLGLLGWGSCQGCFGRAAWAACGAAAARRRSCCARHALQPPAAALCPRPPARPPPPPPPPPTPHPHPTPALARESPALIKRQYDNFQGGRRGELLDKVMGALPPRMHRWLLQRFPDPAAWLDARLRFTRTNAVWCMVGHMLGLGDR
jgi:hypothetical protein